VLLDTLEAKFILGIMSLETGFKLLQLSSKNILQMAKILKDIELDEVLDGEKRKEIFFDLLASVLSLPIGEGFDLEVAKKISLKIKEKLLHADE